MRDIAASLCQWLDEGRGVACAIVVRTWGSSPRPVGSVMAVRDDGCVAGSVSGGCVEGAVIEAAQGCLATGRSRLLVFEAIKDEDAWAVGLSCGGTLHVWVMPVAADTGWREIAAGRPQRLRIRMDADGTCEWAQPDAPSAKVDGEWFEAVLGERERLILIGASHIALALGKMARMVGFEVIVVDPRTAFLDSERLDGVADQVLPEWPVQALERLAIGPADSLVTLSHDPKLDDPSLALALRAGARYVGALGSRSTQDQKRKALAAEGLAEEAGRVRGPVGLPIGAKTPEEIAVSILAELVAARRGAL
ncbi:MAG: hypothetical protein AMXMBFR81_24250 [Chthonomonas sp.]